ncbi:MULTISPECIES: OmpA family protein [unclassified Microcoleus]|uniref:OmpA family protein n=1 Tax=unclassified Microcoleus TaxID=2642155 RepID=UPI002FD6F8FB
MALPKENPADEDELEGFVSKPDESAADAATQLEPLLNLLVDLKIIASSNQQNAESEGDSSGENNQAGDLGGLMDLLGISSDKQEEVAASLPETADRKPESGDSWDVKDEFKSLLFATHKLNTSELERNYSSAKTIEVSAIVQADLEEKSEPLQELSNLAMKDSLQAVQAQKFHGFDRHLQDVSPPETESKFSVIPHNPIVSPVSNPPETGYLDAAMASAIEIPNLLEQPTEILGQIKQDLNQADSAMETLQNLIFGSKISDIEQVKNLLAENDLPGVRHLMAKIDEKLGKLEHQIYDPQELIELMLPWIAEILSRKITDSREEVVNAIGPIIDEVIRAKTQENKSAMSAAIAELLPDALAQQIVNSPADIARAIAPEIGLAIKEQIRLDQESIAQALAPEMGKAITAQIKLERDSMVDALYPVIGSTISRYMAEAIKTINEKVSNAISVEGFKRKIRSKVQGVSEAELILQESVPFTVQAAFLIHKASGLIISEVQNSESYQLESEMVAGMLTAIRSFVNECIVQPGEASELNQIEYGDSKIILEVAGYCYMAVAIKGEPPHSFIYKLRQTVSNIILNYAKVIHEFNGDPGTIPESLHPWIKTLFEPLQTEKSTKPPIALAAISLAALSLILVPWGIYQYRSSVERRLEANAVAALASTPELAVYRLDVAVDGKTLKLTGKLPNQELRAQAAKIAASTAPKLQLDNRIVAVDVPPDPVLTAAEVQRITAVLNQREGVLISTRYGDRKVTVDGTVIDLADAQKIAQSLKQIPGVQSVISTVKLDPLKITTRIYFQQGTTTLDSTHGEIIASVKNFMDQYPQKQIKIIGHSDRTGELVTNQQLSLKRAAAVRDALVRQGADPKRLQTVGNPNPPADVEPNQPRLLSRCVLFEPITKTINSK